MPVCISTPWLLVRVTSGMVKRPGCAMICAIRCFCISLSASILNVTTKQKNCKVIKKDTVDSQMEKGTVKYSAHLGKLCEQKMCNRGARSAMILKPDNGCQIICAVLLHNDQCPSKVLRVVFKFQVLKSPAPMVRMHRVESDGYSASISSPSCSRGVLRVRSQGKAMKEQGNP